MKYELERSLPSAEGICPEYIINFLNACEKEESKFDAALI